MPTQYRHNHYVPEWYQKRFLPPGQTNQEIFYLSLKPRSFIDPRGVTHPINPVRKQGFRLCFAQDDLYTTTFGTTKSTKIEQLFFGDIDRRGRDAVEYFSSFTHPSVDGDAFNDMVLYMSTQKLRTPKGLDWLSHQEGPADHNQTLDLMLRLRQLYCAVWTECVWLIADASQSNTKFIISDHPTTIYNRVCGPRSLWCRSSNDPDIRLHASHTIFPLTLDKVLILTNLSWVRNPYQSETGMRPNPTLLRPAMFKFTDIQTLRYLSEQEVREINFIIKSRAFYYIGAAQEEWLYPETHVSKSNWNVYGDGYLLMPDPRPVHAGGEIYWGNYDGGGGAIDSYGRSPIDPDFSKESDDGSEFNSLYRFKGEFARLYGPTRRGRSFEMGQLDPEVDTDEYHKYHLSLDRKKKKWH